MWHKCEFEFIYKPKGFMENEKVMVSALREFFMSKGYSMEAVACGDEECKLFTIEPLPTIIEDKPKVIKIPKK